MTIYAIGLLLLVGSACRVTFGFEGEPYSNDGCGDKRGCYACGGTCTVNVAWEPDMEKGVVIFTLWGSEVGNEGHVSMGITRSPDMYAADVYSCINNGTSQRLVRSWNPDTRITEPRNLIGVRDEEVSVVNGEIRCRFTRYMSLDNNDHAEFFNISGGASFYLILSRGDLNSEDLVGRHLRSDSSVSSSVVLSNLSKACSVTAQFGMWTLLLISLIVAFRVY